MLRQFYYTSCQNGLGTSSGYQFNAVTPDLDPDILRAAQTLVSYEPPPSAPAQPSEAELRRFPVALSYSVVGTASALLCRSSYVGRDYSGRFGNFFAHGVHFDPTRNDLGAVSPIDLWESPTWATTEAPSTELPPLGELAPGVRFADHELQAFLDQQGRRAQLYPFLAAIKQSRDPNGRQIVLVESSSTDVARWVAIATRSLPRRLALQLTFTTYTRRPYYASQRLIGITADGDFRFSAGEMNDQYMVFDFVDQRFSTAGDDEWAWLASTFWAANAKATMAQFLAFLDDSGQAAAPTDLGAALAAFATARGREIPSGSLLRGVRWADECRDALSEEFWRAFGRQLGHQAHTLSLAELGTISQRWSKGPRSDATSALVRAYVDTLVDHVSAGKPVDDAWLPEGPLPGLRLDTGGLLSAAIDRGTPVRSVALLLDLFVRLEQPPEALLLERLGRERLGPQVLDGRAAGDDVVAIVDLPDCGPAGDGLAEYLRNVAAQDLGGHKLGRVLAGPLGAWLDRQERDDASPLRLARCVQIGRSDASRRIEMLDELLGEMTPDDLGAAVTEAIRLLWADEPPSPTEARRVLQVVPVEDLSASGRVDWLLQPVLTARALTLDVSALANELRSVAPLLGLRDTEVDLLLVVLDSPPPRGRPAFGQPDRIIGSLMRLERVDAPVTGLLVEDLAQRTLGLGPQDQGRVLDSAIRAGQDQFLDAYRRLSRHLPPSSDPSWPGVVSARFMAWTRLAKKSPIGTELLADVLAPAVQASGPDQIEAVHWSIGGFGTTWADAWEAWSSALRTRRRAGPRRAPKDR